MMHDALKSLVERDDAIQAVHAVLDKHISESGTYPEELFVIKDELIDRINKVCSYTAHRVNLAKSDNRGYWIELPKAWNPSETPCRCSICGHVLSFYNSYPKSKYCPNCGSEMSE